MKELLNEWMFRAPWWSIAVNPFFLPRRALWRAMAEWSQVLRGHVLDVGCGNQPYRRLMTQVSGLVGLELDTEENRASKRADAYYDGYTFPFESGRFQSAVCNQVLEHVFEPEHFLLEINRVLVPDGVLVLSVPFIWAEHEQPQDARRYTSYGLRDAMVKSGFDIVAQQKLVTGAAALCAIVAGRIHDVCGPRGLLIDLVARLAFVLPISLVGAALCTFSDARSPVYLDNFIVARKRESLGEEA